MHIEWLRGRALIVHAAVCAVVVRAALRAGSLPFAVRAARAAGRCCRTRASTDECLTAADAASRRFAHATCLYRALTAYALIAHRHAHAQFHLGTATTRDPTLRRPGLQTRHLSAHAWVTVDNFAGDVEAARYTALWTVPARRTR